MIPTEGRFWASKTVSTRAPGVSPRTGHHYGVLRGHRSLGGELERQRLSIELERQRLSIELERQRLSIELERQRLDKA